MQPSLSLGTDVFIFTTILFHFLNHSRPLGTLSAVFCHGNATVGVSLILIGQRDGCRHEHTGKRTIRESGLISIFVVPLTVIYLCILSAFIWKIYFYFNMVGVKVIGSDSEFQPELTGAGSRLAVVKFTMAGWGAEVPIWALAQRKNCASVAC